MSDDERRGPDFFDGEMDEKEANKYWQIFITCIIIIGFAIYGIISLIF